MVQPNKRANNSAGRTVVCAFALAIAVSAFTIVSFLAWNGRLGGVAALVSIVTSAVAFYAARRFATEPAVQRLDTVAKTLLTVVGMMALLRHPIDVDEHTSVPIYNAIVDYVGEVDSGTF